MSKFQITRGRSSRAAATIAAGRSGIGKTYFVSTIPGIFMVFVEDSVKGICPDVIDTMPRIEFFRQARPSMRDLLDCLAEVRRAAKENGVRRIAFDSLSAVERIVNRTACNLEQVAHMEAKDFKKVWSAAKPVWLQFQEALDSARDAGFEIWLTAHDAEIRESADDGTIYTKHDLMFDGSGSSVAEIRHMWRAWADHVLFIDWEVSVKAGKTMQSKAVGQYKPVRVLFTRETPIRYAKNRANLPEKLPATWVDLERALRSAAPASEPKLRAQIEELAVQLGQAKAAEIRSDMAAAKGAAGLSAVLSRAQGMVATREDDDGGQEPDLEPEAAEQPQEPAPDPKRAEAEAALARCVATYPGARAEIETAYHEATTADDALLRLRRIWTRLAAVKPQLPQRDTSQAALATRITQIVALLERDGHADAAKAARETISEYGAELGVAGIANADLPGCLSEVEAIANTALAPEVAA